MTKYTQIIILAAVFALQYFFEHIFPQKKEINVWKNERFNLLIGTLNIGLTFLPAIAIVQLCEFVNIKNIGLFNQLHITYWLQISISIPIIDCWMYTWHFLNHKIPFLWRFHKFHHKDETMNSTTALRFHIVELLLSYPGKAMVVVIFGINYSSLVVYELLFFIAVVIHHSNMFITEKIDIIYRKIFSSPIMHRIHHSIIRKETNSNFGALFSFWDRLFKTFAPEAQGDIVFGVLEQNAEK